MVVDGANAYGYRISKTDDVYCEIARCKLIVDPLKRADETRTVVERHPENPMIHLVYATALMRTGDI